MPVSVVAFLFAFLFCSCNSSGHKKEKKDQENTSTTLNNSFKYNLSKEDRKIVLTEEDLVEVSDLSYLPGNKLAMVQDEQGKCYIVNIESGKVERYIKFSTQGDFENIAVVKDTVYSATSNGEIFQFPLTAEKKAKAIRYRTKLNRSNNVEGLCYNAAGNELLMACKDNPYIGKNDDGTYKSVYAFKLATKTLIDTPVYLISKKQMHELQVKSHGVSPETPFNPSAIAIHPIDNRIYILSSFEDKMLIVINRKGIIEEAIPLSKEIFKQPEGICFAPDGTMYISNEGRGNKGYISVFHYLQTVK